MRDMPDEKSRTEQPEPAEPKAASATSDRSPEAWKALNEKLLAQYRELMAQQEAATAAFEGSQLASVMKGITESLPDRAVTYVGKILTVGYASLFAIWWITKDVMSPGQNLVIAVMMIGSVGAFVGNELFNVFMMNRIANMIPTATAKPDRNAMMQFLTSLQAVAAGSVKYKGLRQWVLRTSLAMAGIAVAVMLYSMLKNLWAIYAHSY